MKKVINSTSISMLLVLFMSASISCQQKAKKESPYGLEVISDVDEYKNLVSIDPNKAFVDIEQFIPDLILDIRYASSNNFIKQQIYTSPKAFVRKPVADALYSIQMELIKQGMGLKVFDAYRPYAATVKFYEVYPDTTFVAAPWTGSKHNRGCAIDVTLIDLRSEKDLEMPTPFDDFTVKAAQSYMDLPDTVLQNRKLLLDIMTKHGFIPYVNEWWHYNYKDWENFELMDISFEEIADNL